MKFLFYLERAWISGAVIAVLVALYNLITIRAFDSKVYFPLFCAMFCSLIFMNVRGQRRFREKLDEKERLEAKERGPK